MYPFLKKCTLARHQKVCYVILAKEGKQKGQQVGQKIFQLLVSMIDTEKRKMGFHASEHGFHGLVHFLCPFLGGDAVARKKWQQKVKKEREEK